MSNKWQSGSRGVDYAGALTLMADRDMPVLVANDLVNRLNEYGIKPVLRWRSFKDDPPPDKEMLIYKGKRNHDGRYPIGVAYWNVSGKLSDSRTFAGIDPVEWMPLPEA